jgi:hypothetical protein
MRYSTTTKRTTVHNEGDITTTNLYEKDGESFVNVFVRGSNGDSLQLQISQSELQKICAGHFTVAPVENKQPVVVA